MVKGYRRCLKTGQVLRLGQIELRLEAETAAALRKRKWTRPWLCSGG